jgi:hypothetical protein
MFFQSGGYCDGSMPMCFSDGEFVVSDHDVPLGHVGSCPFYIDHRQYEAKHTQLILDVGEGDPEGSSLPPGTTSTSSSDHGYSRPKTRHSATPNQHQPRVMSLESLTEDQERPPTSVSVLGLAESRATRPPAA